MRNLHMYSVHTRGWHPPAECHAYFEKLSGPGLRVPRFVTNSLSSCLNMRSSLLITQASRLQILLCTCHGLRQFGVIRSVFSQPGQGLRDEMIAMRRELSGKSVASCLCPGYRVLLDIRHDQKHEKHAWLLLCLRITSIPEMGCINSCRRFALVETREAAFCDLP